MSARDYANQSREQMLRLAARLGATVRVDRDAYAPALFAVWITVDADGTEDIVAAADVEVEAIDAAVETMQRWLEVAS